MSIVVFGLLNPLGINSIALSTDNSIFLNLTCHIVSNFNNTSTDTEYSVSETSRVPYFYSGFNIVVGSFGGWIQINN